MTSNDLKPSTEDVSSRTPRESVTEMLQEERSSATIPPSPKQNDHHREQTRIASEDHHVIVAADDNHVAEQDENINTSIDKQQVSQTFDDYEANRYSRKICHRQRILHAIKVAVGVLIASQFVLVKRLSDLVQGTGGWAIITVIIVLLPTPGDTTLKMMNRISGTLVAAILALGTGIVAKQLSEWIYPLGHVLIGVVNALVAYAGTLQYTKGGSFAYAFLLGTVTFAFLTGTVLTEGSALAILRAVMITVGGIIGFFLSWCPPVVQASDVARAYVADALLDTSVCAQVLVQNFLSGKFLNPIHDIYNDTSQHDTITDDTFHRVSKAIQISRVPLEAAIHAAVFEGSKNLHKDLKSSGLAVRLALRTLLSADALLRQDFDGLDRSDITQEKLALALINLATSIKSHFGDKLLQLHCNLPEDFDLSSELPLDVALDALKVALHEYIREQSSRVKLEDITGLPSHVSFARLFYDCGRFILETDHGIVEKTCRCSSRSFMELMI